MCQQLASEERTGQQKAKRNKRLMERQINRLAK
jgi:hypothetical protein